jgi:CheY-like chemotaxis protein
MTASRASARPVEAVASGAFELVIMDCQMPEMAQALRAGTAGQQAA